MGLIPNTGNVFKGFTFDGVDSKDYGVYISGDGVFNSPERSAEMVEIPGRNGDLVIDRGRFGNIEVTYPASIAADNEADFAAGISELRNFLSSRVGYCRLEDEYNPDEYRLAVYRRGLEVSPAQLKAGGFEIVFDCMPQRFLKSGEDPVPITSGGTITNPTLFPAPPLLQVWGYGGFAVNGQSLEIISAPIGWRSVSYANTDSWGSITTYNGTLTVDFDDTIANPGDTFGWHFQPLTSSVTLQTDTDTAESVEITNSSGLNMADGSVISSNVVRFAASSLVNFVYGTAATVNAYYIATINLSGGTTKTFRFDISTAYDGGHVVTASVTLTLPTGWNCDANTGNKLQSKMFEINSSQSALGSPLYFDLEIGEAWKIEGGEMISVNNAVTIPAQLPTLNPGANTITFDNTITRFEIVPRWWRV